MLVPIKRETNTFHDQHLMNKKMNKTTEIVPQYWKDLSLDNIVYIDENDIEQIEEWRFIKNSDNLYMVSCLGRVKALEREKWTGHNYYTTPIHIMQACETDERGYIRVSIFPSGKKKPFGKYVQILVADAFIDNPQKKRTVNHKKGNKKDNRVWMLEWNTHGENHEHSYRELGRKHAMKGVTGYANKRSKEILCVTTGIKYGSLSEASEKLGIPFQNISKVCNGKRPKAHGLVFKHAV